MASSNTDDPQAEELVTRTLLETLFETLREDVEREMASNIKDIKKELGDMGQRMDSLEVSGDERQEELNTHCRELLELRDENEDLLYRLEDFENRLGHSNIRIRGAPLQEDAGKLDEYILWQITPVLKDETIALDCTHIGGRPARTPGTPQDILTCLHSYRQKYLIMEAVRDKSTITFEGAKLSIFQDLSPITLQ
ncbi:hypothetical protein NDU88_002834 [Pleurodeles waltl]|uniref:Uncharacterized protein n=1 Tax=Pleurodeles waltl TaxID=8319 RepID=A0AAV7MP67_PLEWA|nr:hypothetical protein NDU88_002834 [Pleurodeles waltl]